MGLNASTTGNMARKTPVTNATGAIAIREGGCPAEARGNGQADAAAGARAFTRRDRREILREAVLR